ncbi:undecaprenyl-phosphate glucose phosphotransferase [Sneathiella marina]|uniref:Undecaprenyl-phosphate glucose phosphotransferase n=1 Tax=Sneathiella marina TaxID=2950108 RepID=A0ABY4W600_9PROT|nr:undecaprenyl-phosphate glucose phosphotransferase [Sneathiella marina]USG61322.1 undecaprenyl-phosphate glucose phosphotransferase [Sneathiella marina]
MNKFTDETSIPGQTKIGGGYPLSSNVLSSIFSFLDSLWIILAGYLSYTFVVGGSLLLHDGYLFAICFIWLIFFFLGRYAGIYSFSTILAPLLNIPKLAIACLTSFMLLLAVAFSLKVSEDFSRIWMYSFGLTTFGLVMTSRVVGYFVISYLAGKGICTRNVVIIGSGMQTERLLAELATEKPAINQVVGIFDDRIGRVGPTVGGHLLLGNIDALVNFVRNNHVDDIIVALPWNADERQIEIVGRLRELPAHVHLLSDLVGFRFPYQPSPNHFGGVPMIEVVDSPLSGFKVVVKAMEDRILGLLLVLAFAPILLCVAIAIRLDSKGPVIFKQKRYGYNNKIFEIYKFRSMRPTTQDTSVTLQATKDDDRITRVGKFIRKTSLDELPQLFNVVIGNMSLVGPRPHAIDHNEEYSELIDGYFARHKVKPGITGWAQVKGFRGETDTLEKMEARVNYDTYYVENWSLFFDLQILAMTAFVGFVNKNAY